MTTSWLIDSNVFVYSFFRKAEQAPEGREGVMRDDSRRMLAAVAQGLLSGVVAQQNLLEFLAIVTSPKRVAIPVPFPEALATCRVYLSFCTLITPKASTLLTFEKLTTEHKAARDRLFDVYLAATALDNEILHICTWNTRHFQHLSGLTAATPTKVLHTLAPVQDLI